MTPICARPFAPPLPKASPTVFLVVTFSTSAPFFLIILIERLFSILPIDAEASLQNLLACSQMNVRQIFKTKDAKRGP